MYRNGCLSANCRRPQVNRAAIDLAMTTCALLQAGGFQILSAHAINDAPRITVAPQRQRRDAFDLRATRGDQVVAGVHVEWRV